MARGFMPGGVGEAGFILRGNLPTAITKYPTGKYGIVGSIPLQLTRERVSAFQKIRVSMVWETEQEVIEALLKVGIQRFQLADCSWYNR